MKSTSYFKLNYDELPDKMKRKALRQVKRRYREILSDEAKLIELVHHQRTTFYDDGSLDELIGLPTTYVTSENKGPAGEMEDGKKGGV
jgi:hypothetical protein